MRLNYYVMSPGVHLPLQPACQGVAAAEVADEAVPVVSYKTPAGVAVHKHTSKYKQKQKFKMSLCIYQSKVKKKNPEIFCYTNLVRLIYYIFSVSLQSFTIYFLWNVNSPTVLQG